MIALLMAMAMAEPPAAATPPKADWIARPTGEDFAAAFPPGAKGAGKAVISCRVTLEGALESCMAISEEPAGQGFGEAALKLAPAFQMSPASPGAAERVVLVPVVWEVSRKPRPQPRPRGWREPQTIPDRPGMGDPHQ